MSKLEFKKRIISRLRRKLKERSGIMLLAILWMLVILTALAVGLGRNTKIELVLTKHAIAKAKSKYYALAGIEFARDQIQLDSKDKMSFSFDNLYSCAVPNTEELSSESLFRRNQIGSGYFSILYEKDDPFVSQSKKYYGLSDEDGRININSLDGKTAGVLRELIVLNGFSREDANIIAYSIVDWIDPDSRITAEPYGAEDDYYSGLDRPYHCKNLFFDSKEELFLIRGMTPEIYNAVKEHITVFPKKRGFLVNFDTAPEEVLKAIARAAAGGASNTEISDADSAVEKLVNYRKGDDGEEATSDDRIYDVNMLALNAKEKAVLRGVSRYRSKRSQYIRVNVFGTEENSNIRSNINAIISRKDLSLVYWNRT